MDKIGAFDFAGPHMARRQDGSIEVYERRLRRIIVSSTGKPKNIPSSDLDISALWRLKGEHDRIVQAWVLVPVGIS